MHRFKIYSLLIIFCLPLVLIAQDNSPLKTVQKDGGFLVKEGNQKVLYYQQAPKSQNGKYTRNNYIHPLYGFDGAILSEDFPEDHPHQRGIFWAWHQVILDGQNIGDMWTTEDFAWDVASVDTRYEEKKLIIQPVVYWKSPNLKGEQGNEIPFAKEKNTIAIYPENNEMRVIDFTIRIQALKENLYIGGSDNEKGYGGFSARIKLPEDITFTADYGQVKPKTTAVPASPWMDFSGSFTRNEDTDGILIVAHSSNPNHPPEWIIRANNSMQNPVYPGRKPVHVPQSKPLILRYRMLIHQNSLNENTIEQWVSNYK
ncbi:MAG: DUF6807 family protein [Bacteroidota bacterium]